MSRLRRRTRRLNTGQCICAYAPSSRLASWALGPLALVALGDALGDVADEVELHSWRCNLAGGSHVGTSSSNGMPPVDLYRQPPHATERDLASVSLWRGSRFRRLGT
jgi:hypothetical protein